MPRECTVCSHPESFAINEALVVEGESNRAITRQYGLSKDAVRRHREHIPELLVKASEAMEVLEADALLNQVEGLRREAMAALEDAKTENNLYARLKAIETAAKRIDQLAELRGDISRQPLVHVAFVEHPDYRRFEDILARALQPYPAARFAVADALKELEK